MHDTAQQVYFADVAFYIEMFLLLLLFASFYFASERKFKIHRKIIEFMVLVQTFLVFYMMNSLLFTSYGKNFLFWHALVGVITYILIMYTFLLMENKIPYKQLQVSKKYQKTLMRVVMLLWWLSIVYGAWSLFTIVD